MGEKKNLKSLTASQQKKIREAIELMEQTGQKDELDKLVSTSRKDAKRKQKEENNKVIARQRWEKVGARRINQLLMAINALEKCSHPYNYNYTDTEIKRMFKEIDTKIKHLKQAFKSSSDDIDFIKKNIFD